MPSTTRYLVTIPVTNDAADTCWRQSSCDTAVLQLVELRIEFTAIFITSAVLSHKEEVVPYLPPPRLLCGIAAVNLPIDFGEASIALTDAAPADCPNMVIRSGSLLKSSMLFRT